MSQPLSLRAFNCRWSTRSSRSSLVSWLARELAAFTSSWVPRLTSGWTLGSESPRRNSHLTLTRLTCSCSRRCPACSRPLPTLSVVMESPPAKAEQREDRLGPRWAPRLINGARLVSLSLETWSKRCWDSKVRPKEHHQPIREQQEVGVSERPPRLVSLTGGALREPLTASCLLA